MKRFHAKNVDHQEVLNHLQKHGFAVIEVVLGDEELQTILKAVEVMLAAERETPFDPGDGPVTVEDAAMKAYLADVYQVSQAELMRVVKRNRHARAQNHGTPWPVEASRVNHNFMHISLLLDNDTTQRSYNLPAKMPQCGRLIEDPIVLPLLSAMLKEDFILSDISATSIGPHTNGGYWHVDAPLTMLPEPLPDIILAVQTVWMLDEFTTENGATCVVPGSHRTLKKPPRGYDPIKDEVALTGPAGSLAL